MLALDIRGARNHTFSTKRLHIAEDRISRVGTKGDLPIARYIGQPIVRARGRLTEKGKEEEEE